MNNWKQGQDEGEGDGCGLAGDMGATEGADLYSTFFFSKCPPMPSCPRQSGNTTRQLLITIYTLFHKKVTFIGNFLLAPPKEGGCSQNPNIPWVRKEPACPKAEHTHACFIHQFGQINWQYLAATVELVLGNVKTKCVRFHPCPWEGHCFVWKSRERIRYTNKKN